MNLETLQPIVLAMSQERSPARVFQVIVDGMVRHIGFALARIWVRGKGDRCDRCSFASECPDRRECLHLVASAGESILDERETWTSLEGQFSRFPIGVRKVGQVAATGQPVTIGNLMEDGRWAVRRDWIQAESIRSFAGHPLIFRGEVLGVLGIFCRRGLTDDGFRWLGYFANQAAVALANARAFEEIERLTSELKAENALLMEEAYGPPPDRDLVGNSVPLRRLLEQVQLVGPTEAAILIQGESGSGKELVARAIHRRSRHADKPMVRVNCAAIPRELFESEFFGHVKGAFTGAVRDRVGRFQLADRGTLFLDEVGEIPLELQSKLLRVLQEGEFERIGETTTRKVTVRIIAATNRDLQAEAAAGRFREDLFYRLSVFPLSVPPLRERSEDIPLLTTHFVRSIANRLGVDAPRVTQADLGRLVSYGWPGNVRELAHVVERAVILSQGGPADFRFMVGPEKADPQAGVPLVPEAPKVRKEQDLRREQIENIRKALGECDGRVYGPGGAAEILGIPPTTLSSRIRRWGLTSLVEDKGEETRKPKGRTGGT